jgi:murein DD-endopeptidase MepM/ murein hydrolase activator NlpD
MKISKLLSHKDRTGNRARPVILTLLAGVSFFLSLFFILSPDASSERINRPSETAEMLSVYSRSQPEITTQKIRLGTDDSFYSIMTSRGVNGSEVVRIVKKTRPVFDLRRLKKDTVMSLTMVDGAWDRIEYPVDDFDVLVIERGRTQDGEVVAEMTELPYEIREVLVSGTIDSSLYEAGVRAGADPQALMELSDIFAWDIDFASDIRRGDRFSIIYEVVYVEGREIRNGRVLGAEMDNDGRKYTAIYYEGDEGATGYYDAEGKSLRRTLLKSPLRYRRVTSHFSNRRYHPIKKRYRPHHGVDYGAPVGTPIEAAGSGRVVYSGWKGGYGNYIKIKHNNSYSTAYGHLSRIKKTIRKGRRINQGDIIGYVGSTGISTGPHLHYEVYLGKRLVNPLGIKSAPVGRIPADEFERFTSVRDEMSARLSGAGTAFAMNNAPEVDSEGNIVSRALISKK